MGYAKNKMIDDYNKEIEEKYTREMSSALKKALENEGFFVTKCESFFYTVSRIKISKIDVKYFNPHRFKKVKQ